MNWDNIYRKLSIDHKMPTDKFKIILADDDEDDCMFFREALDDLSLSTTLKTVFNGLELMNLLQSDFPDLPDVIFMDMNMPLKSGMECLMELKEDELLRNVPVIFYSTSFNPEITTLLYDRGAQYYIRKPANFSNIKSVIKKSISLIQKNDRSLPKREEFVIYP